MLLVLPEVVKNRLVLGEQTLDGGAIELASRALRAGLCTLDQQEVPQSPPPGEQRHKVFAFSGVGAHGIDPPAYVREPPLEVPGLLRFRPIPIGLPPQHGAAFRQFGARQHKIVSTERMRRSDAKLIELDA